MMVSQTLAILSGIFALALASVQSAESCSGEFCSAAPSAGSSLLQATVARHWKGEDMHNEFVHESEATVQDKRAKQSETHKKQGKGKDAPVDPVPSVAPGSLERKLKNLAEFVAQTSGDGTLMAEAQDVETDLADEGLTGVEDDTEAEAEIVDLIDKEITEVDPVEAAEDGIEFTNDDLTALHHGVNMEAGNNNTFQGDMMPDSEEQLALFQRIEGKHRSYGGAGKPWPDGVVKYCLSSDLPANVIKAWKVALEQYKKALACLTFLDVGYESGSSTAYDDDLGRCRERGAIFVSSRNAGCYSFVGRIGNKPWRVNQVLNLASPGCDFVGTAMHEIGHALGMAHEQARPDRDEYVRVDTWKYKDGQDVNFNIDNNGDTERPYDILSLMHYGASDFAKDKNDPVITVLPKGYEKYTSDPAEWSKYQIGNRIGLSKTDVLQLADMYNNVVPGGCTAKIHNAKTTCADKLKNGVAWADNYGDCDKYRAVGEEKCKTYTSGFYCCGCGNKGGWKVQSYGDEGSAPAPPPRTPLAPPAPTAAPTAAPTQACTDDDESCPSWAAPYCAQDWARKSCPFTCGACQANAPCKDSTTYRDPQYHQQCSSSFWQGAEGCSGESFSEELEKNCPLSCNKCTA